MAGGGGNGKERKEAFEEEEGRGAQSRGRKERRWASEREGEGRQCIRRFRDECLCNVPFFSPVCSSCPPFFFSYFRLSPGPSETPSLSLPCSLSSSQAPHPHLSPRGCLDGPSTASTLTPGLF